MKNQKILGALFLSISILFITGCAALRSQPQQDQEPTTDISKLRTQVAQTVVAKVTYDAALTKAVEPSTTSTAILPSAEILDLTPTLTATLPIVTYTPTKSLPTASPTATIKVIYPTWTPTFYPDRAELVMQSPEDGTYFRPYEDFDLVFSLKNTGSRIWNTNFYLKFVSGEPGKTHSGTTITLVYLPKTISPGESIGLIVDMIAPGSPGGYSSNWSLINDDGTAILSPNLVFNVSN